MINTESLVATQKANLETLLGLTHKAFAGVEKLVELNLQMARSTLSESADNASAALSAKDAQQLLALQAGLLQPAAEKAAAYSRSVYDIAAEANAEVVKVAEAQVAAARQALAAVIENAAKNAPAGTENGVALVKQAMEAANSAFDNVQKASKQAAQQAVEIAESNFKSLQANAGTVVKAASKGRRAA